MPDRPLVKYGRRISALPTSLFATTLIVVGVVRTGVLPIGPEWVGWLRDAAQSLPEPSEYLSSSLGPSALMRLLGAPGNVAWWGFGAILWAAVFAVSVMILSRHGVRGRLLAIGLVASPAFAVSLTMLGHYDLWIIAGSTTVALARRWWISIAGAVIAILGNPEQSVPSAFSILLLAIAWRNRDLIRDAVVYLVLAVFGGVAVAAWASASSSPSRSGAYLDLLPMSIKSFLGVWPLAIYSWLGPLWIVVIAMIGTLPQWRRRILATAGVVLIPGLMSITTLDGTRVFVAVGTGALVALVAQTLRGPWKESKLPESALAAAAAALVFTPSVIVDTAGSIRLPYSDWISQVGARWQ